MVVRRRGADDDAVRPDLDLGAGKRAAGNDRRSVALDADDVEGRHALVFNLGARLRLGFAGRLRRRQGCFGLTMEEEEIAADDKHQQDDDHACDKSIVPHRPFILRLSHN
nr:hypothetical protein DBT53_13525 [Aerococcus mictus]